jgi:Zn-dependent peptidase ImmA (M78 family)
MNSPNRAEQRAIKLLDEFAVNALPVPVEELALALDAEIAYEPYDGDVSGMLYRSDDHTLIGVNTRHAQTRQRFTIAHEIGHLVMHKGTPMFIDRFVRVNWRDGASNQQEAEANSFAAELLMPRRLVEREVIRTLAKKRNISPHDLAVSLAKSFAVSAEAMQYRLANLGVLDPSALIG